MTRSLTTRSPAEAPAEELPEAPEEPAPQTTPEAPAPQQAPEATAAPTFELGAPRRGRTARRIGWTLALLAAVGLGALWLRRGKEVPPSGRFDSARVDRGRIVARVTATGTVSALVTVDVGSQVSGRIQRILVDYNAPVRKGQVIATIDPRLFRSAVQQARANFRASRAQLARARVQADDAELSHQRIAQLAARKLVARADLDTASANARAARALVDASAAAVEQASAALHQARLNLAYATIVSPINGIVITRNVNIGQTVAATFQAPTLFVIAEDLRKMQVDTSVPEADVGRLRAGMEATFKVDAYPGKRFRGRVRQIRNSPQMVQNIVTYDAVIDVANPRLELKPGMTANVSFAVAEKVDVLRVPNTALRFRPGPKLLGEVGGGRGGARWRRAERPGKPNERTIWLLRDGVPRLTRITTGISDGSSTEVEAGLLRAGDRVIIGANEASGRRRRRLF